LSIGSVPALKKNLQSASSTLFYPDSLHCIFTVPVKAREYNQNVNLPISLTEKIQIYWKLLSGSCKNWKKKHSCSGFVLFENSDSGSCSGSGVKRNFWLHAMCACTEWYSTHQIRI